MRTLKSLQKHTRPPQAAPPAPLHDRRAQTQLQQHACRATLPSNTGSKPAQQTAQPPALHTPPAPLRTARRPASLTPTAALRCTPLAT